MPNSFTSRPEARSASICSRRASGSQWPMKTTSQPKRARSASVSGGGWWRRLAIVRAEEVDLARAGRRGSRRGSRAIGEAEIGGGDGAAEPAPAQGVAIGAEGIVVVVERHAPRARCPRGPDGASGRSQEARQASSRSGRSRRQAARSAALASSGPGPRRSLSCARRSELPGTEEAERVKLGDPGRLRRAGRRRSRACRLQAESPATRTFTLPMVSRARAAGDALSYEPLRVACVTRAPPRDRAAPPPGPGSTRIAASPASSSAGELLERARELGGCVRFQHPAALSLAPRRHAPNRRRGARTGRPSGQRSTPPPARRRNARAGRIHRPRSRNDQAARCRRRDGRPRCPSLQGSRPGRGRRGDPRPRRPRGAEAALSRLRWRSPPGGRRFPCAGSSDRRTTGSFASGPGRA